VEEKKEMVVIGVEEEDGLRREVEGV